MNKFISKAKKIVSAVVLSIISFPNKIFAVLDPLQDIPVALYGVESPRPNTATKIWEIARTFIIPIVLFIGLVIYFSKSKSSKWKKVLITLGVMVVTVILYFVVDKIIYG